MVGFGILVLYWNTHLSVWFCTVRYRYFHTWFYFIFRASFSWLFLLDSYFRSSMSILTSIGVTLARFCPKSDLYAECYRLLPDRHPPLGQSIRVLWGCMIMCVSIGGRAIGLFNRDISKTKRVENITVEHHLAKTSVTTDIACRNFFEKLSRSYQY